MNDIAKATAAWSEASAKVTAATGKPYAEFGDAEWALMEVDGVPF